MGANGQRCFDEANRLGGLVAKLRLASLTQITSTEAATRKDTPELTAKLEAALVTVRAEFASTRKGPKASKSQELGMWTQVAKENEVLRRQLASVADLLSQRSLFVGNVNATVRRMTEAAAAMLQVERVSVWFSHDGRTKMVCADLFERTKALHSAGTEQLARDFPAYFEALAQERTIAAEDAQQDPRTRCFSDRYLKPHGIGALLDVPVWARSRMVGVIRCEHVADKRAWTSDEETLVYVLSSLVALTLEQVA
jgi:GAF domain-containing protein